MKNLLWAALLAAALGLGPDAAEARDSLNVGEAPFISGGPFYIARDKGYFDRVGLDVHTKTFNDGALAVPALISGELDVSVVTMSAGMFNSIAKGAPMAIILDRGNNKLHRGGTSINVTNTLYAAGLKGPADMGMLKGKRFGVTAVGSINQYEAALALMKVGLDPRTDVVWVTNIGPPDLVKMLGRDLIDAADLGWQYGAYAQSEHLGPLVMDGGSLDPDGQVGAYATRREVIAERRDALVRFAMAIIYSAKEFNEAAGDPDKHPETLALLAKAAAAGKPALLKSFAPQWTSTSEDGLPSVAATLRMQDFWVDTFHLGEKKIPADQLFDLSIAKEAGARLAKDKPFGP